MSGHGLADRDPYNEMAILIAEVEMLRQQLAEIREECR